MSSIGKPERATQNRIIKLFQDKLGYKYLGKWEYQDNNSNIEEKYLSDYLLEQGYTPAQISKATYRLKSEASQH